MRIFVDGDSCPADRRILLAGVVRRRGIALYFVLQRAMQMRHPPFPLTLCNDVDSYILQKAGHGDLVITRDLPLAAKLVNQEITVIDFCGRQLSSLYLRERFARHEDRHHRSERSSPKHPKRGTLRSCRKQFADALEHLSTAR